MARRRQEGGKKADLGFEVPEFDEDEFIRKETISFRTTLILFLYSILTALVTFLVWAYLVQSWFLALLVGLGLGVALRWMFPALKVDVSHFKKKEWTGTGFLYFFSWLAFFIFMVNPPLYDGVAPEVQIHITPDAQEPGNPVNVTVLVLDNVAVDEDSLQFRVLGPDGSVVADAADLEHGRHDASWSWRMVFEEADSGTYTVEVTVSDEGQGLLQTGRHTTTVTEDFQVEDEMLRVFLSGDGRFTSPDDSVRVEVPETVDVYRAWLRLDDDTEVPLRADQDATAPGHTVWRAHANFAGFQQGNNTFRVHVQEHDSYWLEKAYGLRSPTAELVSSETYTVTIEDPQLLGEVAPDAPRERTVEPLRTPAPGALLTLTGILGAVFLVARRRTG